MEESLVAVNHSNDIFMFCCGNVALVFFILKLTDLYIGITITYFMAKRYNNMSLLPGYGSLRRDERRQESIYIIHAWMPAFAGMTYWIGQFEFIAMNLSFL